MKKLGFTFVEILVVIVIIGILAVLIVPNVINSYNKSILNSMIISENEVLDSANLYVTDYCKNPINGEYAVECSKEKIYLDENKVYFCLSTFQKDKILNNVKYKDSTSCNGIVVYDLKSENGNNKFSNGKTYLYCGNNPFEYMTKGGEEYLDKYNYCLTIREDDVYTITYNLNGGSLTETNPVTYTENDSFKLKNPSKSGYTFSGWTGSNGSRPSLDVKVNKGTVGNLVYTANYVRIGYDIEYKLDGGLHGGDHPLASETDKDFNVSNPSKVLKTNLVNNEHAILSVEGPLLNYYTFSGWNITGMDSSTHYIGGNSVTGTSANSVMAIRFKNLRTSEGKVSFSATWTAPVVTLPIIRKDGYICKWTSSDGDVASGGTYTTTNVGGLTEKTYRVSCQECSAGSYCIDNNTISCPTGYTSSTKTYSINDCYKEIDGGYHLANASDVQQTMCIAGQYKEKHRVYYGTSSYCNICPTSYTSVAGDDEITDCYIDINGGKIIKNSGDTSLTSCTSGTYKGFHRVYYSSTSKCDLCPNGYGNSNVGSNDKYDCYMNVPANKYVRKALDTESTACDSGTSSSAHIVMYNNVSSCTGRASYNISYDLDFGSVVGTNPTSATFDRAFNVTHPTKKIQILMVNNDSKAVIYFTQGSNLPNNYSEERSYQFSGWTISNMDNSTHYIDSVTNNATTINSAGTTFKNLRSTPGIVNFKANWVAPGYTLPKIYRKGYTCVWNSDEFTLESGATYHPRDYKGATSRTWTVSCSPNTYYVTYVDTVNEGGSLPNPSVNPVTYDSNYTVYSNNLHKNTISNIELQTVSFLQHEATSAAPSPIISKGNYVFESDGWESTQNSNIVKYSNGQIFKYELDYNITMNPVFKSSLVKLPITLPPAATKNNIKLADVTYDYNGYSSNTTSTVFNSYTFNSWNEVQLSDISNGREQTVVAYTNNVIGSAGDSYTPEKDITLYPYFNKTLNCSIPPTMPQYWNRGGVHIYKFDGWNSSSSDKNDIDRQNFGTYYTEYCDSSNITLYATWEQLYDNYTITFNPNGGKFANGRTDSWTQTYRYLRAENRSEQINSAGYDQSDPSRTGYKFKGWSKAIDQAISDHVDVTLTAQWELAGFTYTFYPNGGSGTTNTLTCINGQSCTMSNNSFTNGNKVFNNWNTNADGSGTIYAPGQNVTDDQTSGTNINLYAQWSPSTVTLRYECAQTGNIGILRNYLGTNKSVSAGSTLGSTGTIPPQSALQQYLRGYSFVNWIDGSRKIYNSNTVITGNTVLYCDLLPNTYTIVFNPNGGSGSTNSVNCTYDSDCSLTLNGFSKSSSTFNGWNKKSDGSGTSYSNGQTVKNLTTSGTVNLYAMWKSNCVDICPNGYTLLSNGDCGKEINYNTSCWCPEGSKDMETTPGYSWSQQLKNDYGCFSAYKFDGYTARITWGQKYYVSGRTCSSSCSGKIVDSKCYETANKTQNCNPYTITYKPNGGSGSMSNTTCGAGVGCTLNNNQFTRNNYVFLGWSTNSSATSPSYYNGSSYYQNTANDVTLYAIWSEAYCPRVNCERSGKFGPVYNTYIGANLSGGAGTITCVFGERHIDYNSYGSFSTTATGNGYCGVRDSGDWDLNVYDANGKHCGSCSFTNFFTNGALGQWMGTGGDRGCCIHPDAPNTGHRYVMCTYTSR